MADWKLHIPTKDNVFHTYKCGLVAGQRVALKMDLVICDHQNQPTGKVHPKGEIWVVLPGIASDPVLWLRQADGERHTWDDDADSVAEWLELVETGM
jgi:hypothetical protein